MKYFGKNEFFYAQTYTDYTVYAQDGRVFKHVRNRHPSSSGKPAAAQPLAAKP